MLVGVSPALAGCSASGPERQCPRRPPSVPNNDDDSPAPQRPPFPLPSNCQHPFPLSPVDHDHPPASFSPRHVTPRPARSVLGQGRLAPAVVPHGPQHGAARRPAVPARLGRRRRLQARLDRRQQGCVRVSCVSRGQALSLAGCSARVTGAREGSHSSSDLWADAPDRRPSFQPTTWRPSSSRTSCTGLAGRPGASSTSRLAEGSSTPEVLAGADQLGPSFSPVCRPLAHPLSQDDHHHVVPARRRQALVAGRHRACRLVSQREAVVLSRLTP